ncbi:phage RecT family protein [Streptococcus pseudoporcinus]|uniref:Phage RecT family protein n=1 Tax=Streptococcus pseudoporcinus TaxID=361101 RepID=A0A4U9Y0M7_9STRE|nr:recombinase RecT [Streptococcus pseudoporcinus]VTS14024.1 phage RecT family protein [Streptococcus pseudoporcinus]VTS19574.1 phage RecT family protein [Streptococcus pseudoporcinus]
MANQLTVVNTLQSDAVKEKFEAVMGEKANGFVSSVLSVVTNNNLLAKADFNSVYTSAMKAAVLDLPVEPSLGMAYIVPYKGKAQFQIGYKGLIQLAQRSGKVTKLNSGKIYKGQFKSYNALSEELDIDDIYTPKEDEEVVGYFGYMKLSNGFEKITYWTKERVEKHGKKYSQSYDSKFSPWQTNFDAMAEKTVLKSILSTYAPLTIEMQNANDFDNGKNTGIEPLEVKDVTPENDNESLLSDLLEDEPSVDAETGEIMENTELDLDYGSINAK